MLIVTGADSWATETVKALRERCRNDLIYLCRDYLAWYGIETGVFDRNLLEEPGRFHLEMADALNREINCILLGPRIHLKTEVATIGGSIQYHLKNENNRILIVTEAREMGLKRVRQIKSHYRENKKLRNLFPEIRIGDETDDQGTLNKFDLPSRKGPQGDYSLECVGLGGAVEGGHFDRLMLSDIVTKNNVPPESTPETMEKCWSIVQGYTSLLDHTKAKNPRPPHTVIEGAIHHDADSYSNILRDPGYADFVKVVYSVWDDPSLPEEERQPMWPMAYSKEYLLQLKGRVSEYEWSCQYLNRPMPEGTRALFKTTYFKHYEKKNPQVCPCCGGALKKSVTVDLAISERKTADRTAIVVMGFCAFGSAVVLHVDAGRWTPYDTVEKLYLIDTLWEPTWIGIESVAFQKAMIYILHEEGKKKGRHLPVMELFPDANKARRASILAAVGQSRGIWVVDREHDELVDECLHMTINGSVGRHDDIVDAASYSCQWIARGAASPVIDIQKEQPLLMGAASLSGDSVLRWLEDKNKPRGIL